MNLNKLILGIASHLILFWFLFPFKKQYAFSMGTTLNNILKLKKSIFHLLVFFFFTSTFSSLLIAQQIVYYHQGFENSCPDNWGYSGGNVNTETARTGFSSARVGRLGESTTLTMQTVDVSGIQSSVLSLYHSIRSGSGPGMDTREGAVILVALNGGTYSFLSGVGGFGDHNYPWTSADGGDLSSSAGCNVYQTQNPLQYDIPLGTTSISIKVISIKVSSTNCTTYNNNMNSGVAGNYDRNDEGFFIDDVQIAGLAPTVSSTNNGVLCSGLSLNLFTNPTLDSMSSSWIGPNSFTSNINNPNVTTISTSIHGGTYTNDILINNCSIGNYTTNVVINSPPTIIFLSPP